MLSAAARMAATGTKRPASMSALSSTFRKGVLAFSPAKAEPLFAPAEVAA